MAQNSTYITTAQAQTLMAREGQHAKAASGLSMAVVSSSAPAIMAISFPLMLAGCFTVPAVVAFALAGVAAACAFSIVGRATPYLRTMGPLIMVAVLVVCGAAVLLIPDARVGLFSFANAFIAAHDQAMHSYLELIASGSTVCGSVVFAVLLGIVVGMLCWFLTRLRWSCVSLLVVVTIAAFSLRLHLGYAGGGAVLGVAAWLIQCRFTQLRNSSYSPLLLFGIMSGLLTLCFATFAVCGLLYKPIPAISDAFAAINSAQYELRYGKDSLPGGDLQRADAMNDGDASLTLSINGRVSDDLLLRGFVGAGFNGTSWEELGYTAYEGDWKGSISWLAGKGLVPVEQRAAFNDEDAARGDGKSYDVTTIDVDASNANSRWRYLPYTLRSIEGVNAAKLDGMVGGEFLGDRNYRIAMDNVPTSDVLHDASWLESVSDDYTQAETVYAAFAKQNYLDIDEAESKAIQEYLFNSDTWDQQAATSEYSVISRVRTMLDTLATYSEDVEVPSGEGSFTEWFLGQQRKGNSAYFATVATLAFREQGIPARYVEGYRAGMGDISAANAAGQPLQLDAHDAHAWVEIYLDGLGWTPIEVTPGFYTQALNVDSVIDVGEAFSNGSQDVAMQGESVAGQMDEEDATNPIELPLVPIIVTVLLVLLGLIALVILVMFEQRVFRRMRTKKQIAAEDQSVCVPTLYRNLSAIMKAGLSDYDRERPLDCVARFESVFKGIDSKEYCRVIELHQAYAFGGHELRVNELRTLRRFNERLYSVLPPANGMVARVKRYFIDAL